MWFTAFTGGHVDIRERKVKVHGHWARTASVVTGFTSAQTVDSHGCHY